MWDTATKFSQAAASFLPAASKLPQSLRLPLWCAAALVLAGCGGAPNAPVEQAVANRNDGNRANAKQSNEPHAGDAASNVVDRGETPHALPAESPRAEAPAAEAPAAAPRAAESQPPAERPPRATQAPTPSSAPSPVKLPPAKSLAKPGDQPELAEKLDAWAKLQQEGALREALVPAAAALELAEAQYGADDLQIAGILIELGRLHTQNSQFSTAREHLSRALKLLESQVDSANAAGPQPAAESLLADALYAMAEIDEIADYRAAEQALERCIEIRTRHFGDSSLPLGQALSLLGAVQIRYGENLAGVETCRRAVEMCEQHSDRSKQTLWRALHRLGNAQNSNGRYRLADESLHRALDLCLTERTVGHLEAAYIYYRLAANAWRLGQITQAEELYQQCADICDARFESKHLLSSYVLNDRGAMAFYHKRIGEGIQFLEQALELKRELLGERSLEAAISNTNLGGLYATLGQTEKGVAALELACEIFAEKLGPDAPQISGPLNNLAGVYHRLGERETAFAMYERCLELDVKGSGWEGAETLTALTNLIQLSTQDGDTGRAGELLEHAIKGGKASLPPGHSKLVMLQVHLATHHAATGELQRAEQEFCEAIDLLDDDPQNFVDASFCCQRLGAFYLGLNQYTRALDVYDRARRFRHQYCQSILPGLSEQEQHEFLEVGDREAFLAALSIASMQSDDPHAAKVSAGWALNGKALMIETAGRQARLLDAPDAETQAVADRLTAVRESIASLVLSRGDEQKTERLRSLLAEQATLEQQLARKLGGAIAGSAWVEIDEVRARLPQDAVLVEFAVLEAPSLIGQPVRSYYAWVIPPQGKGDVKFVPLPEGFQIDRRIHVIRDCIPLGAVAVAENAEAEAYETLATVIEDLAKRVLRPLEQDLRGFNHWYLSTDGDLTLIPWSALPLADGSLVVEKHRITHLTTGRELLREAVPDTPADGLGAAVIVAAPDYDLGLPAKEEPQEGGEPKDVERDDEDKDDDDKDDAKLFTPLPGTEKEARAITESLGKWSGGVPVLYLGAEASEATVKTLHSPRAAVFSTHGFFVDLGPGANPLMLCGLGLAGANHRDREAAGDDGILTGLEIVGLDLRGTRLVVLSACDTGVGRVRDSEGITGLRYAFQLAGARQVASTLWSIPDEETADLMEAFFSQLAAGAETSEALRQAQLAMIRQRREKNGAAHPLYWAAFTLTGKE